MSARQNAPRCSESLSVGPPNNKVTATIRGELPIMRHHLKSSIAVTMFLAAFVCASVVWATSRSPAQQKATKKCDDKFMADVQRCLREHPELSPNDCSKAAAGGWRVCMSSAGLARGGD